MLKETKGAGTLVMKTQRSAKVPFPCSIGCLCFKPGRQNRAIIELQDIDPSHSGGEKGGNEQIQLLDYRV
jgi:hypothetical protein